MAGKEQLNPIPLVIASTDKIIKPFSYIESSFGGPYEYVYTPFILSFGGLEFDTRVSDDFGENPDDEYGHDRFQLIQLSCTLRSVKEFEWLQNYYFQFTYPKNDKHKELTQLHFEDPLLTINTIEIPEVDTEEIIGLLEDQEHVHITFSAEIHDIAFDKEQRSQIELKVIDKRSSPGQQKLPLELVT